ncbi:SPX domain-containing protein 1-like [Chenopodium quinoa]|uniref:SPX domain-containing protein 1-like n=1 Tax=Chenopodium quinoa TaxID=63459 RepID=UPI000B777527|nr:SPX domain-containing protein 1-like [Chenopodium quinoa]
MKFGKSLSNQIEETLPEWRDKFLSYKDLKKRLKLIVPKNNGCNNGGGGGGGDESCNDRPMKKQRIDGEESMTKEEVDFLRLLEDELEKFNTFFVEKEEEYIIRLKELQDRVAKAKVFNYEEMLKVRKEIVDFHGEMVLLENYSALNYTGLVKILKKYDKRTGALIRLPFIQRVLQQPFFTTDLIYKLVKECERMLDLLFPTDDEPTTAYSADGDERCDPTTSSTSNNNGLLKCPKELAEIEYMESLYMKSTISALRALKEIRSKSSTVSMFSLPPLQLAGAEETWKKIPILEQVAK